jgi:site-specific recombinase XerD
MLEDLQIRNLSPLTQRAYAEHVSRFARHFGRSPAQLGPEEIRKYLVYLTNDRQLAPSSMIVAVAALRFLYTVSPSIAPS